MAAVGCRAKNVEAIALDQNVAPRTLQRLLESIVRDEQLLRDRCQQLTPLAASTKRERPNVVTKQRAGNASTTVIAAMMCRAEKKYVPDDVVFQTRPHIALDLIDRAKTNGIEAAVKSGKSVGHSAGERLTPTNLAAINAR